MIFYCSSCIFPFRFWPSFPPGPGKAAEMPAFYHPGGHNFPVRQARKVFCRQQESPFVQRTLFYTAIIRVLNPVIRGWSNYHKGICAKRTFSRLGTFIYWQLKRWAKYQHGNKNRWWIYYRYFQNNHFTDQRITKKGIEHNRLYRIAYVPIRYHVKVKSNANPYLPEFDKYFFKRTKWREDLAKECKQVTTFVMQETINHGRVSLRRDSLKRA